MGFTNYYGAIFDGHGYGRPGTVLIDPKLGQRVGFAAPPSGAALERNAIIRGAVSGSMGRITRVAGDASCIIEAYPTALGLPPGGAFAQNHAGPLTSETVNIDNGGTAAMSVIGNAQDLPGLEQHTAWLTDRDYNALLPPDLSDTPYWDPQAKVCQLLRIDGLSGTAPFLRKGDRCTTATGAFTVHHAIVLSPTSQEVRIIRKTGTLSVAQTVTNTTLGGPTTGTLAVVNADPPLGIFVPFCSFPNLRGQALWYEFIPDGNGKGSLGFEARFLHRVHAYHAADPDPLNRGWRFVPHSSYDEVGGFTEGILGGVTVQVVKCSGTFPASGSLVVGQTVTGPGGWSATVHGWNSTTKYLFVRQTNGAVLGAGTLTLSGGATVTGTGACYGWQKGSTHWNAWAANVAAALAAPAGDATNGALFNSQPAKWAHLILAPWETEINVHAASNAAPFPLDSQIVEAWQQWVADIRTHLGRADLPVTLWAHRPESQSGINIAGIPYAYFLRLAIHSLRTAIPACTVVDSVNEGCQMANELSFEAVLASESTLYLRRDDYGSRLSEAFWRHSRFGQTTFVLGNGRTPIPVGIHLGQSNATGFISAGFAIAFDADPDLWPAPNFKPGLSTVDSNALSFNHVTEEIEPFSIDVNANGFWGTLPGTCGPEVPVVQRMKYRFAADMTGSAPFLLFKATIPGSCLNANVKLAAATWDPALSVRPSVVPVCNVTAIPAAFSSPARGRFTAAPGTFSSSIFETNQTVVISGSMRGYQGFGGNNTPPYGFNITYAIAPDGSWLEVLGAFVDEAGTGTGFLVNNGAGYGLGVTSVVLDTGTGTILPTDRFTFANHGTVYTVTSYAGGVLVFSPGLTSTVPDNTAITIQPRAFTVQAGPPPAWPEVVRKWNKCVDRCMAAGYVPVPRYIVQDQGESDLEKLGEYEAALQRYWNAVVDLFELRLKGDEPIAKCVVLTTKNTSYGGLTVSDGDLETLRGLQASVPTALGNCVVVDPSDLSMELDQFNTFPRLTRLDNGFHLTGRAQITKGFRIDRALGTLGPSKGIPAHPKGELAVDADGAVNGGPLDAAPSSVDGPEEGEEGGGVDGPAEVQTATDIVAVIDRAIQENGDVASYTVNGRFVQLRGLGELLAARKYYVAEKSKAQGLRVTKARFLQ